MTSRLSKRAWYRRGRLRRLSGGGRALIEFAFTYLERLRSLAWWSPGAYWILEELGEQDALVRELNEFIHGLAGKELRDIATTLGITERTPITES